MGNSYMKILQKGFICVPWEKSNRIQGWKDMGMKKKTLFFFGGKLFLPIHYTTKERTWRNII